MKAAINTEHQYAQSLNAIILLIKPERQCIFYIIKNKASYTYYSVGSSFIANLSFSSSDLITTTV